MSELLRCYTSEISKEIKDSKHQFYYNYCAFQFFQSSECLGLFLLDTFNEETWILLFVT